MVPYRTAAIHDHDVIDRGDGIRMTTPARTALDLARWLHGDDLLSVIEQTVRDDAVSVQDFYDVAADWLSPQRPWPRQFMAQLDRRIAGGAAESHPEVRAALALAAGGVFGLVRQHQIEIPGYG